LCDAVTGRTDSQRLLEQAERANLFLVPLDGQRRWWRYHRLFADLLRARLRQTQRSGWAGSIRPRRPGASATGWSTTPPGTRWVAALPAELVRARPRLLVAQAVWALLGYLPGQPTLDAVTRALHTTGTTLSLPGHDLVVLAGWAIGALLASLRLFQWEPRAPR
jgi:LuxR family maltose regulon positive regulatory protein